ALKGVLSVVAIAMLTWMLVWMTQQARLLKRQVEGELGAALQQDAGAGWGVFSLICVAVLREGFETVLFVVANLQQGSMPALGVIAGLVGAIAIGSLLFKWGLRINIRLFFQVMGVLLLLIVSGLVISALKNFDAAISGLAQIKPQFAPLCFYPGRSCILGPLVWDASHTLPDNKFPGVILKALFGYRQKLYLVQAIAYCGFLATTGFIYFQSLGAPKTSALETRQPTENA
ncbi:MAG TPA: FTR1 family protein, partial [Candidatus Caenarcaniphilales bacterium]